MGHLPLVVFVRHGLQKRLSAGLAAVAAAVKHDSGALAVDGGIHDHLITAAKANDLGVIAVWAVCGWFGNFGVYLVIVLQFGYLEHFLIRPIEYIGHARPG